MKKKKTPTIVINLSIDSLIGKVEIHSGASIKEFENQISDEFVRILKKFDIANGTQCVMPRRSSHSVKEISLSQPQNRSPKNDSADTQSQQPTRCRICAERYARIQTSDIRNLHCLGPVVCPFGFR